MTKEKLFLHVFSILFGVILFLILRKTVVSALVDTSPVNYSQLDVQVEKDPHGIGQLKVFYKDKLISQTTDNFNHAQFDIENEHIVWMSQIDATWQIFYKNVLSDTTLQLTTEGNNVNPHISGGKIAWEKQEYGIWQVYLFDTYKIKRITPNSYPKQLVDFAGNYLIYQQKTSDNSGWDLYLYNLESEEHTFLSEGLYTGGVSLNGEYVTWVGTNENSEKFAYTYQLATQEKTFAEIASGTTEPVQTEPVEIAPKVEEIEEVTTEDIQEELDANEIDESENSEQIEAVEEESPETDGTDDEVEIIPEEIEESTESGN